MAELSVSINGILGTGATFAADLNLVVQLAMGRSARRTDSRKAQAIILEKNTGTQVHATAGTINGIRETAENKRAYWTPIIGANYPQRFAIPDVTLFCISNGAIRRAGQVHRSSTSKPLLSTRYRGSSLGR
jgi:hypothetical protein